MVPQSTAISDNPLSWTSPAFWRIMCEGNITETQLGWFHNEKHTYTEENSLSLWIPSAMYRLHEILRNCKLIFRSWNIVLKFWERKEWISNITAKICQVRLIMEPGYKFLVFHCFPKSLHETFIFDCQVSGILPDFPIC